MRLEGQRDGGAVDRAGLAAQLGDQGGVAAMDAIEIADGDRPSATIAGRRRAPVDRIARHVPIHPPVSCSLYNRESPRVGRTVAVRKAVEAPWRFRRETGRR